jgi:hypothetical protein
LPAGVTINQLKAVALREMAKASDEWHEEFVMIAAATLKSKFPCNSRGKN